MRAKIGKWGNSLALRLPRAVAEEAASRKGRFVDAAARGQRRKRPAFRPQPPEHRLEELVAEMKRLGPENEPALESIGAPTSGPKS